MAKKARGRQKQDEAPPKPPDPPLKKGVNDTIPPPSNPTVVIHEASPEPEGQYDAWGNAPITQVNTGNNSDPPPAGWDTAATGWGGEQQSGGAVWDAPLPVPPPVPPAVASSAPRDPSPALVAHPENFSSDQPSNNRTSVADYENYDDDDDVYSNEEWDNHDSGAPEMPAGTPMYSPSSASQSVPLNPHPPPPETTPAPDPTPAPSDEMVIDGKRGKAPSSKFSTASEAARKMGGNVPSITSSSTQNKYQVWETKEAGAKKPPTAQPTQPSRASNIPSLHLPPPATAPPQPTPAFKSPREIQAAYAAASMQMSGQHHGHQAQQQRQADPRWGAWGQQQPQPHQQVTSQARGGTATWGQGSDWSQGHGAAPTAQRGMKSWQSWGKEAGRVAPSTQRAPEPVAHRRREGGGHHGAEMHGGQWGGMAQAPSQSQWGGGSNGAAGAAGWGGAPAVGGGAEGGGGWGAGVETGWGAGGGAGGGAGWGAGGATGGADGRWGGHDNYEDYEDGSSTEDESWDDDEEWEEEDYDDHHGGGWDDRGRMPGGGNLKRANPAAKGRGRADDGWGGQTGDGWGASSSNGHSKASHEGAGWGAGLDKRGHKKQLVNPGQQAAAAQGIPQHMQLHQMLLKQQQQGQQLRNGQKQPVKKYQLHDHGGDNYKQKNNKKSGGDGWGALGGSAGGDAWGNTGGWEGGADGDRKEENGGWGATGATGASDGWGNWGGDTGGKDRDMEKKKQNRHASIDLGFGDKKAKQKVDAHKKHTSFGGWGTIDEEEEYRSQDDHHIRFSSTKGTETAGWGGSQGGSSYSMPSRTLTHALNGAKSPLHVGVPKSDTRGFVNVHFPDSGGAALEPVRNALFGKTRLARDRIYWAFPSGKDPKVAAMLKWIDSVSQELAVFGLHKFLQTRERGALITNVEYRLPDRPTTPVFDWVTFDYLQPSMDKILQESVASYDPETYAVVFVMLSSKSGNSVAMWRKKVYFSKEVHRMRQGELAIAMSALRRDEDYKIYLDERPASKVPSLPPKGKKAVKIKQMDEEKPKKKKKWWRLFF